MKNTLKIIMALVAMLCAVTASALDLPVKRVNGKQYYYYKARKGESVHGLSKKLGLTREQIVQYNPGVADGVRRGETLYFPVEDFENIEPQQIDDAASEAVVAQEPEAQLPAKGPVALVALPFGLESTSPTRQNRHALDFYKGFLIAADTLSDRRGQTEIVAVDFVGDASLADTTLQRAAVAVLPEDAAAMDRVADRCRREGTYVLNLFAVRDTTYLTNPYMMQASIPAEIMYRKAVEGLFRTYPDYTPVIIRNTSGRNEKDPFTEYLAGVCESQARRCLRIDYTGNLSTADLAPLEANATENFVIVPSSGTLPEFNKFAYVVRNFRDSRLGDPEPEALAAFVPDTVAAIAGSVALFGYPDWMAFRSDAEELLHALEATVYSRYYDDYDSFTSRNIDADFVRWYGEPMIESVPSQGLLGYDAGCFIIKNMQANNGEFRPDRAFDYRGAQSTFHFERVEGGGFVNTALYIVRFLPYGRLSATVQ